MCDCHEANLEHSIFLLTRIDEKTEMNPLIQKIKKKCARKNIQTSTRPASQKEHLNNVY